MWLLFRLWFHSLRGLLRSREDLVLENLALRHQLEVCRRPRRRVRLTVTDRRLWSTLARSWSAWRTHVIVVHPDTVVRWHRSAWRRHWARKNRRRGPGRPRIARETQDLIRQMARENPRWGAIRIVGALRACGIDVSASTVRNYRRQALRRPPSPSWRTCIGTTTIRTPVRAPQANSIAERVIGTLRRECVDHVLIWNEAHLRRVLTEFVRYYNEDRPHRALDLEPPSGPRAVGTGPVVSAPVLGGLHHVYRRPA